MKEIIRMKKEFSLLIVFLVCGVLMGQTATNDPLKIPYYIPKSPEATAFAKYGDIQAGEYTGIPDISIPIHEVKSGELSVPIKLSYHASGIQVGQEATWVGLGWNLIAGGSITYTPVGGNDQINPVSTFPWSDRKKLLDYIKTGVGDPSLGGRGTEDQYIGWTCGFETQPSTAQVTGPAITAGLWGQGEIDIYSANFLNYSFKFFMHPQTNTPVIIGRKNKCKIELNGNVFIITGEDGIKYFFGSEAIEWGNSYKNAWHLSQIVSPNGQSIAFNYKSFGITQTIASMNERYGVNFPKCYTQLPLIRSYNESPPIYSKYLTSIETNNEKVTFNTDSSRIDIKGNARRLKSIQVIDKTTNTEIQRHSFTYDYFTGSTVGGDYTTDDTFNTTYQENINVLSKRLKLISLTRHDANLTKGEEYSFAYNESISLPMKTSFSRDYWGYYNGQENSSTLMPNNAQHTLIPNIFDLTLQNGDYLNIPDSLLLTKGANRGASPLNITAGMLQSINFPTGGKTVFKFEPNTFSNQTYISAEDRNRLLTHQEIIGYYNNPTASAQYNSVPFTVNKRTMVHFTGTIQGKTGAQPFTYDQLRDSYIVIVNTTNGHTIVHNLAEINSDTFAGAGYNKSWDENFYLDAGNYTLICSVPSSLSYWGYSNIVSAHISYDNYNLSILPNLTPTGGGVRVQTITNYDINGKFASEKKYTYKGGKLLIPLNYLRVRGLTGADDDGIHGGLYFTKAYILSSDSYNESAYTGIHVGYDQVQVTSLSGSNNNGKEIVSFQNTLPKNTVSGYPVYEYCYTNGDLLNRTVLNASNDTIRTENNTYAFSDFQREFINFSVEDNYVGPTGLCTQPDFGVPLNLKSYIGHYTIIKFSNTSIWSYLKSKETIDYLNGKKISSKTEYAYNPLNYYPREIKVTNSDNKTRYTRFTYPVDYTSSPYDLMISLHIINPVIEQSEYMGVVPLRSTLTSYSWWGTNNLGYPLLKPNMVQTKTGSSDYLTRIIFKNYDSIGNLLYATKDDATRLVYLWGYNKTYPVARIENATMDQVNTAFGGSIPDLGVGGLSDTQISSLRNGLPDALISTYTYKSLVGITSVTDPRGITTNYAYDTFNRLYLARNDDKNITNRYRYGYQNAPDNGQGGYTSLTVTVTTDGASYSINATGSATVSAVSDSKSYTYSWSLKNSNGTILQTGTSSSFSYTCSQSGPLTVQCIVTDNTTGQTGTAANTVMCYAAPTASVTIGASYYMLNGTGSATVAAGSGSGNFSYAWSLKNSSGTVLQTSTSSSFSYTCSQVGILTVQCVVTDNTTGQTTTDTKTVPCYTVPTATVTIGASYYMLNGTGNATVATDSGSGSFSYAWSLINSSGTVLQTATTSLFNYTCSQAGTLTVQCVVTDNTTGQTATNSKTVACYTIPTTTVTAGATYYKINDTGNATATATGGTGSYTYSWSLKNSVGTILQSATTNSFSYTCSQAGILTIQCVATDNTTGQSGGATTTVPCYAPMTAATAIGASYYVLNNTGNGTITPSGGSGNYLYYWYLKNSGGTTLQSGTTNPFTFTCSQTGTLTVQFVTVDKTSGQTLIDYKTVPCYAPPTVSIQVESNYYLLNNTGSAIAYTGGGSGSHSYSWSLKNNSGTILQTGTSSSFSYTCSQVGTLTVQCVVTDNTTGQTGTATNTVICYAAPTASVTIGASYYMLNGTGSATVAAGSGSGNFSYAWSLKNSSGTVLQTSTSSSFSYTCSQVGILTVQCVVTDNTTGQTTTDTKTVPCYTVPTATVTIGASYYMLNGTGNATVATDSGSGSFSYAWSLINSSGTVLQTATTSLFNYTCSQAGTLTVQCVVTDNTTGQTATNSKTVACYTIPTTTVTAGATYYKINDTGNATATATGGTGSYTYSWSLKNSVGTILQSATTNSFSYTCSQAGILTIQCVATDNTTGQSGGATTTVPCYAPMTAATAIGASYYVLNNTGNGTITPSGGSGNYLYYWYLKNSGGTTLQSGTTNPFTFTCSQTGTLTVQFVTVDKTTGQTLIDYKTIPCYPVIIPQTITVYPGTSSCNYGATGTAMLGSSGGSGNFTYNWYLKNSLGTVFSCLLNTTSSSFSYNCGPVGILTLQCVSTDNIIGTSTTASANITCNAVVVSSSNFTFQSGYKNAYNSLSSNGTAVSFVLSFSNSSQMNVGVNYYVATLCQGCQPIVTRTIKFDSGGRTWEATFNPDKSVYCKIVVGTYLPAGSGMGISSSYNLW